MRDEAAEAGSSSAPSLTLLPANVLTVFLAQFHTRHGNQIDYQYPPAPNGKGALIDIHESEDSSEGIDLSGMEWKVLPSGGHLIDRDVIYFQPSSKGTTGVACFRNLRLSDSDTTAASQRGARMVSVGLVLQCDGPTDQYPSALAQQLATVPHLSNLDELADKLAADPSRTDLLKSYFDTHRARSTSLSTTLDGKRMKQLRMRRRRDPRNLPHDPISHMPALCGSLGALLPHLLKKLMLPRHRLLIFSPSPPLVHAARLGFNLADLVGLAIARSGKRHENLQPFARGVAVEVKGQIGVHDIPALEDEEKSRQAGKVGGGEQGWIAWSTDKILMEKPHLFDSVLDLSPLVGRGSQGVLDKGCLENASTMARLLTVTRPSEAELRSGKVQLKPESWTTREFATFNELDAQAQRHAERVERMGVACVSRRKSKSRLRSGSRRSEDAQGEVEYAQEQTDAVSQWRGGCARGPRRSGGGTLSAALAFLRYWLAGWWFLPKHWRYGLPAAYVLPLGIRGDGGVRASILVMPEDESDNGDDDLDGQEDRDIADEDDQEEERRSTFLAAEPSNSQALPIEDTHTTTNSSSDTEGLDHLHHSHHHHLIPPDPLLAAVGASPVRGDSDRPSLTHSLRRRSTDRSLNALSNSGDTALSSSSSHGHFGNAGDHFRSILSDSLWMVWSHWTTALVSGLLDVLEDRLAQIEQEDEEAAGEGELSQLLVKKVEEGLVVSLGPADMASLGLSAGNKLDVELVETLGGKYLQLLISGICESEKEAVVRVDKGWSLFRWLL